MPSIPSPPLPHPISFLLFMSRHSRYVHGIGVTERVFALRLLPWTVQAGGETEAMRSLPTETQWKEWRNGDTGPEGDMETWVIGMFVGAGQGKHGNCLQTSDTARVMS